MRRATPPHGGLTASTGSSGTDSLIHVAARRSPFRSERILLTVPEGARFGEIVALAVPNAADRKLVHVRCGGEVVPQEWWHARPKPGASVEIAVVPAGGDTLKIVLLVAVIAAATAVTGGAAAGLFGAGTLAAGSFGAAALGVAISIGGTLAINALIPPVEPTTQGGRQDARSYSVSGGSNSFRPYQPIPRVLGSIRMVPPLAASTYTELDGEDQYLRMLVTFGYGPLDIDDVRIGDTAIEDFDDVETEWWPGEPGQVPELELFPGTVVQSAVGVELTKDAGWVTRTTERETDWVEFEIAFQQGLGQTGKKTGDKLGRDVEFEVRYRPNFATTAWVSAGRFTLHGKTTAALRRVIEVNLPGTRAQWDVGLRRLTDDVDPNSDDAAYKRDASTWTAMRSIKLGAPVLQPGISLLAVRIRATKQLSGQISDLSGRPGSICLDWNRDSRTWVKRETSNPASLFRMALQGGGVKRPVPNAQIDLPALQDWHEWCRDQGYRCKHVVSGGGTLWEALRLIAATGRAMPDRVDGRWTVIVDRPKSVPVQMFTPRNSWGFKGRKSFVDLPHALRVRFPDETQDFAEDERIVYDDGRRASNSTLFEEAEFPGVTDPAVIHRFARFRLAEVQLRPEVYEFKVDWEHLVCRRGDLIRMQHDVPLWGASTGRIKSREEADGAVVAVTLDETILFDPGRQYVARIRHPDGHQQLKQLANIGELTARLEFDFPVPLADAPGIGDLVAVGITQLETVELLVKSITPEADLSATLTCVDYSPAIYTADTEEIPDWNPRITAPSLVPYLTTVRSDESVMQRDADGSVHVQAVVSIYSDGTRELSGIESIELRWRVSAEGDGHQYRSVRVTAQATEVFAAGVEIGETYAFSARYRFKSGKDGAWSPPLISLIEGPRLPPPDVEIVYLDGDRVAWLYEEPPPDLAGFRVRYVTATGATWENGTAVAEGLFTAAYVDLYQIPEDAIEVLVKAETTSGIQSPNAGRCAVSGVDAARRYPYWVDDQMAAGFPGTKTGAVVIDGDEYSSDEVEGGAFQLRAQDTARYLADRRAPYLQPREAPYLQEQYATLIYEWTVTLPEDARSSDRITVARAGIGSTRLFYRWVSDAVVDGGDDALYLPDEDALYLALEDDAPYLGLLLVEGSTRPFVPWRDGLRALAGERLAFRLIGLGGSSPIIVSSLAVRVMAEVQYEYAADAVIKAPSTKIALSQAFRLVLSATGTLQGTGTAATLRVLTKTDPTGPTVAAYTAAGVAVDAVADIAVSGV